MPRKHSSTEQIVTKRRQAEVELGRGLRTPQVCETLGVKEQTYYHWRKECGGLRRQGAGDERESCSSERRRRQDQSAACRPIASRDRAGSTRSPYAQERFIIRPGS